MSKPQLPKREIEKLGRLLATGHPVPLFESRALNIAVDREAQRWRAGRTRRRYRRKNRRNTWDEVEEWRS